MNLFIFPKEILLLIIENMDNNSWFRFMQVSKKINELCILRRPKLDKKINTEVIKTRLLWSRLRRTKYLISRSGKQIVTKIITYIRYHNGNMGTKIEEIKKLCPDKIKLPNNKVINLYNKDEYNPAKPKYYVKQVKKEIFCANCNLIAKKSYNYNIGLYTCVNCHSFPTTSIDVIRVIAYGKHDIHMFTIYSGLYIDNCCSKANISCIDGNYYLKYEKKSKYIF